ncbi:MAG TPA: hypothetical protein PLF31_01410 [Candidatus Paceibacterota bacterium]|nr:hypothetical protein [Candidatus Paceibacterota bacterium]
MSYASLFVGVFFFISSVFSSTASAEVVRTQLQLPAENDFIVEPGKAEIFINPGETVTRTISITSRIAEDTTFSISAEDFVGSDNPQNPVVLLGEERGPYSLKDLLIPEITTFTLSLGEKITVPITISIPEDAEPRGYYGAVIVGNRPEGGSVPSTVEVTGSTQIISRIGVLFLLRVNGDVEEEGNVEEFKMLGPKKLAYQGAPEGFEILYRNTGNVHLVPHGKITVRNFVGTNMDVLPVDAYFSLPDSLRYREVLWGDAPFMIGRYTAELEFYKGYGSETEMRTVAFWVLPYKIIIPALLILLLISIAIYFVATRFEFKRKL